MKKTELSKVIAIDENSREIISVAQFLGTYEEFKYNQDLLRQTSRIIKVIMRHPSQKDIKYISTKSKQGYIFRVHGKEKIYEIEFKIKDVSLILLSIR